MTWWESYSELNNAGSEGGKRRCKHKMAALEALQKVWKCHHHLEFAGLISAADEASHPVVMPSPALQACKASKISRCRDDCPLSSMTGTYFSLHVNFSSRGQWGWMAVGCSYSPLEHWNLPFLSSFSGNQNTPWLLKAPLVLLETPVFQSVHLVPLVCL